MKYLLVLLLSACSSVSTLDLECDGPCKLKIERSSEIKAP